jgi:hypothetical protein
VGRRDALALRGLPGPGADARMVGLLAPRQRVAEVVQQRQRRELVQRGAAVVAQRGLQPA